MNKAWSLFHGKAIINFSRTYPDTFEKVLDSTGFHSILDAFLKKSQKEQGKNYDIVKRYVEAPDLDNKEKELIIVLKLLTIMNSKELKDNFPEYGYIYDNQAKFRGFIEDLYTYWRLLERYAILYDGSREGLGTSSFIDAKMQFDNLILNLYRKITNNVSLNKPKVYRQIPAGTHVGLILKDLVWAIPEGYGQLKWIPFIKEAVIEAPFITYPKRNKRDGVFKILDSNPLTRGNVNNSKFLALPIWVGDLLCYVFCHRNFLTHLVSLTNLFEMAQHQEVEGQKPDIILTFGVNDEDGGAFNGYYFDQECDIMLGYLSNNDTYDYFGYMKKMILTLHNSLQIKRGNLPIHGAMVHIKTREGNSANIVIVGDSGAGKSESIEAFRVLAKDYISELSIVFDDMGSFVQGEDGRTIAYGTETGAFVRLDDLDAGYAFEQFDRSIFMNPDRINSRLITPISTYEEIMKGHHIDLFLYANNYDKPESEDDIIEFFNDKNKAIDVFVSGKRMAKGTTTEEGITTSYFANPFGPVQLQEDTDVLIEKYFQDMFDENVHIGQIKTQLGIEGMERKGPELAALQLFEVMKKLDLEVEE